MEKISFPFPIPSVSGFEPGDLEQLKMDCYNREYKPATDYDCPKCRNKETIAYRREDGRCALRDCVCKSVRRSIRLLKASGMESAVRELTFDRFRAKHPWQKKMLEICKGYAADPKGWLLLCGQSGSGKTHLCSAVCRELLLKGKAVRYMSWRADAMTLKRLSTDAQRDALLDDYKNAQVLYIDDLFKTGAGSDGQANPTAADVNLAFEILNHRYFNRMITILSTEKSPLELVNIDEATGSRILELAGEQLCHVDRDIRKNYRLKGL